VIKFTHYEAPSLSMYSIIQLSPQVGNLGQ